MRSCALETFWNGLPYFFTVACLAGPTIIHAATAIYVSKKSVTFKAGPKGVGLIMPANIRSNGYTCQKPLSMPSTAVYASIESFTFIAGPKDIGLIMPATLHSNHYLYQQPLSMPATTIYSMPATTIYSMPATAIDACIRYLCKQLLSTPATAIDACNRYRYLQPLSMQQPLFMLVTVINACMDSITFIAGPKGVGLIT